MVSRLKLNLSEETISRYKQQTIDGYSALQLFYLVVQVYFYLQVLSYLVIKMFIITIIMMLVKVSFLKSCENLQSRQYMVYSEIK